jgi:uncharacterized membrane protein YesL
MIGFFLKKAFFDGWDNLLMLAVLNAGFILLVLIFLALPGLASVSIGLTIFLLTLLIYLFHFYAGGVSLYTARLVTGPSPEIRELPSMVRQAWKVSAAFGTITVLQVFILLVGLPFYFSIGGIIGLSALSVLFWISLLWLFMSQWIFPVRAQLDTSLRSVFKKSALLFFDNPGFSLFLGLYTIFNFLLSIVTVFLMPGFSGILLSHQVALKLRIYKYDYLEEHPGLKRGEIPWEALLVEEKEKVGHRSLKGMIFPWKE